MDVSQLWTAYAAGDADVDRIRRAILATHPYYEE